jgi:hypothetical protein
MIYGWPSGHGSIGGYSNKSDYRGPNGSSRFCEPPSPDARRATPIAIRYSRGKMQAAMIVTYAVLGAIVYGIVHDQITVRLCIEYFTIGHPPVFGTASPTLLALGWGVVATWWVGLPLGFALAVAARAGPKPKRTACSLIRPMIRLLLAMAVCALVAGVAGAVLARSGSISLWEPLSSAVPRQAFSISRRRMAHTASYLAGILGGCALVIRTWTSRQSQAKSQFQIGL